MARILLADDDDAARDLIGRALQADGHVVWVAEDGLTAQAVLENAAETIDLLVSDVQMPGLDGVALAERALHLLPGLKIVLMSGFADALDGTDHLRPGLKHVMTKPFTLDQVRAVVRTALAG